MTEAILSGILLGLALMFAIGPILFKLIRVRISYGYISAFFFIGGVWLSDILWIVVANLFSGLLEDLIEYKKIIAVSGGSLLIGIGLYYLAFKKYDIATVKDDSLRLRHANLVKLALTGFLINTLNPGVIALWFAATTKSISNPIEERIATFGACLAITILADILKINLAGKLKAKLTDKNIVIINRISGLLFLLFGVALIIGGLINRTHVPTS
ncbi:MAG: LysE family transporter [Ferruginibacter sp.]